MNHIKLTFRVIFVGMMLCGVLGKCFAAEALSIDQISNHFATPPASARPWVFWFWVNGNITREGLTADLEAMQRVGIGGAVIMEVNWFTPKGPATFASPAWREMFKHAVQEADRLGIQLDMNNAGGWSGSGGPWIKPAGAMQKLTWSETRVKGPQHFEGRLPEPPKVADYYQDVALLAFPTPRTDVRIDKLSARTAVHPDPGIWAQRLPPVAAEAAVSQDSTVELTEELKPGGLLSWDVPEGEWTLLRIGHTTTGATNVPAPEGGEGLDCDKLSKEALDFHFAAFMEKIIGDVGPRAGKTLVSTHTDSWEVGSQNWTPRMREEFKRLRGYDPLLYLPVVAGRYVKSAEVSERFLWDLRQTISDLIAENYGGHLRELAHRHGLRLSMEAYDGTPCDDLTYAGAADDLMAEFWTSGYNRAYSCVSMASAAHTYGQKIVMAEAFSSMDDERWRLHPGNVKALGDWAFCQGINRFVFHRYAHQPWLDRRPGMTMGIWGLHYERTQTWWEQSQAWHAYVTRCQLLLQQGLFNADLCYLGSENSPQHFVPPIPFAGNTPERPQYNYDGCAPKVVLERMRVEGNRLVLSDGMSYQLLVLPKVETMTPRLLSKIAELVKAGATVVGAPPHRSPSLEDYPRCDQEVQHIAGELWGDCNGSTITEHRYGQGRIVWGKPPERVLEEDRIPPDFDYRTKSHAKSLRYIHKTIGDAEFYFVANKNSEAEEAVCAFRVSDKLPELWRPETGHIEGAAMYEQVEGTVRMPLQLGPTESVFVVFRKSKQAAPDQVIAVARNGKRILNTSFTEDCADNNRQVSDTFTMAAWARPAMMIDLPQEANAGVTGAFSRRNDALYPPPGHEIYGDQTHAGSGLSIGQNGVVVCEHSASYFAPVLTYGVPLQGWTHIAVVYHKGRPSLYLNGKLVHEGLKSKFIVHPGVGVEHDRSFAPFSGELGEFRQINRDLEEEEIKKLMNDMPLPSARPQTPTITLKRNSLGKLEAEVWKPGKYEVITAKAKSRAFEVAALPEPLEIGGPWDVHFEPHLGAPDRAAFEKLSSWSGHAEQGIRYFSGHATYLNKFIVTPNRLDKNRRIYLDLGKVQVMAEVKVNGKDLGIVWKTPYRVEITQAARAGENSLEVRVVNLWPNRLIGDEELPEDVSRDPAGCKEWPKWLLEGKPNPAGRHTFSSWKLWKKGEPLLESGLLGPVQLISSEQVNP